MFHQPFSKTEASVSFSNLSRLSQLPTESAEKFIARFKRSKHKCKTNYLESEYIKLAQRGLKMERSHSTERKRVYEVLKESEF